MNAISNVSRREFVKTVFSTGALVLSASILPESLWAQTSPPVASATGSILRPNVFVAIQSDDTISIVAARSEMGTGISTALPLVARLRRGRTLHADSGRGRTMEGSRRRV